MVFASREGTFCCWTQSLFHWSKEVHSSVIGIGKAFVIAKPHKKGFKCKAIVLSGPDLNAMCMCLDSQVVRLLDYNSNQRWGQNKVGPESVAFSHGYWQGFLTLDKSYNLRLIWGSALIIWSICSFPSLSVRCWVQNKIMCVCVCSQKSCSLRTKYLDSYISHLQAVLVK